MLTLVVVLAEKTDTATDSWIGFREMYEDGYHNNYEFYHSSA